jgi:hypothetical protein
MRESLVEREARYQAARERIFGTDVESGNDWQLGEGKDREATMPKIERNRSGTPVHVNNITRNPRGPEENVRGFGGRSRKVLNNGLVGSSAEYETV